jgi:hypothetical protein
MRPLAIAVVGGMSVSTFLTLFVVPTAYVAIHRVGDKVKAFLTGVPAGSDVGRMRKATAGD